MRLHSTLPDLWRLRREPRVLDAREPLGVRRAVQVVAEHQQEGLGGELLLRGEHGVAEAELLGLHDELHLRAGLVDLLGIPE
mgnify:CR=1 FL=1